MKKFRLINYLLLFLIFVSCNTLLFKVKLHPKFKDVDPKVQTYADVFFDLSNLYGIKFKNKVTIGFDNINKPNIVAQCDYGLNFREITIDSTYWQNMTVAERNMVIEHEMGHCYCNEGHKFGKNHESYDLDGASPLEGFFEDTCPKSLMYPYTIYEGCFYKHFNEYMEEMFQNCKPY